MGEGRGKGDARKRGQREYQDRLGRQISNALSLPDDCRERHHTRFGRLLGGAIMRYRSAALILAFACCSITSCSVNVIAHDERAAAESAAHFAELAFVKSDHAGAHALIASQTYPADTLAADVEKMHPKGRPAKVEAIEFEPLPGQRAMNIYLKGTRGDEAYYYRLLMVGDKGSGYKVNGLWRGSGPYPPSARKPL